MLGVRFYLYLVIDLSSPKVVAWDLAEREDPAIAADLVSRGCLRERISKGRRHPLILHADNGNAMRATTLASRLEELGVPRSLCSPRLSIENPTRNPCSARQSLGLNTPAGRSPIKRLPAPVGVVILDWYNHRHRHSGIKFVRPHHRYSGQVVEICRHRLVVYKQASQRNQRRWSRSTGCWRQPELV